MVSQPIRLAALCLGILCQDPVSFLCSWQPNIFTPYTMGRPKRHLLATAEETSTPPAMLAKGQAIARVIKAEGTNLFTVELPLGNEQLLVELPSRFRSQIWIRRGGYVVVDTSAFGDRDNKLGGEIVNVVRDEKHWRKQAYWSVALSGVSQ